ncbi:MAG: protoporphyrinogen oxidase [Planctomycetes bacterium]|nr:protoporphyrinogen oxidase [Planctomycetota bacterium]MCW8136752.1 protoporphyrinogen oxidase [Planctomycetota bacterium]
MHIAVIGAGISGLAAAYRLHKSGARVTLLEAGPRAGGVIHTLHQQGCLLETGPDCWAGNKPAGVELARELGLDDQLIGTREGVRRSFVLCKGRLVRLPEGFFLISPMSLGALAKTRVLSLRGKLRMALELVWPRRYGSRDESLASFVRRRFGQEALERIAQPMIAGIYTADPEKLSLKATFPQFMQYEQEYGSVIAALRARGANRGQGGGAHESQAAGPRYGMFVTLKQGMGALIDALVNALPPGALQLNTPVHAVMPDAAGVSLALPDGPVRVDGAVLALPAHKAAGLLAAADAPLARALGTIEYAGASVVNFIFDRAQISHAMDGIGAVIPAVEGRRIIAFSFSSIKFEGRAPEGTATVRVFMGGALAPDIAKLPPAQQQAIALDEIRDLAGIHGEPRFASVTSHHAAMPQYHVGHLERVAEIRRVAARHTRLRIIGNAFDGVGTPDCIRGANEGVKSLLSSGILHTT